MKTMIMTAAMALLIASPALACSDCEQQEMESKYGAGGSGNDYYDLLQMSYKDEQTWGTFRPKGRTIHDYARARHDQRAAIEKSFYGFDAEW